MQPSGRIGTPVLRYLPSADVERCLPDVATRLDMASTALAAISRGTAEMPAKVGVHPRPGALLHAMPAWLRETDLVGLKWVSAYPGNNDRGLPATNALVLLNDAETGLLTWLMDGGRITAIRTAAVSGVAMRLLRPSRVERVAMIGAGIQARSHAEVVATLLPDVELVIYDLHRDRADALATDVARDHGLKATAVDDARDAAAAAQIVITAARMGTISQVMTSDWLAPGTLVIAVDFATYASAELARAARVFATDDREQFVSLRASGLFEGYPDPTTTLGALIDNPAEGSPEDGDDSRPVLVNHLGIGLADVVFASEIARRADEAGMGMELPR
jgi:ornithine cyclodeaminase/alanine dehydrogenase-like protein (mu-crystallin family)